MFIYLEYAGYVFAEADCRLDWYVLHGDKLDPSRQGDQECRTVHKEYICCHQEKAILFCWQFVLLFVLPALVAFCYFVWGRTFWRMNGLFLCHSFVYEWVKFWSYKEIFHMLVLS